jgi:stage II sporulation protein D
MRVRLAESVAAEVSGATLAADARGRRVTISATRAYRFVAWERDGLEMIDIARHHTRAHLYAPVRLTGPSSLRLAGRAENGVTNGRYRGAIVLHRSDQRVLAVNEVGLERYLYGVVPAEMPSSWPAEALRSQAVAARSYALTSRRPAAQFDVYADTRSQMYRGVAGETTRTTDAVRGTKGVVLTAGGSIARTLFHSSSGGRTAAVEDAFGGPPVSYLRAVDDPYDTLSPHHDWTVTLTDEAARQRLASILQGTLVDIVVTARTPGGRAATVRVTGTLGTRDLSGATARSLLGLRSTWFEVRRATD